MSQPHPFPRPNLRPDCKSRGPANRNRDAGRSHNPNLSSGATSLGRTVTPTKVFCRAIFGIPCTDVSNPCPLLHVILVFSVWLGMQGHLITRDEALTTFGAQVPRNIWIHPATYEKVSGIQISPRGATNYFPEPASGLLVGACIPRRTRHQDIRPRSSILHNCIIRDPTQTLDSKSRVMNRDTPDPSTQSTWAFIALPSSLLLMPISGLGPLGI